MRRWDEVMKWDDVNMRRGDEEVKRWGEEKGRVRIWGAEMRWWEEEMRRWTYSELGRWLVRVDRCRKGSCGWRMMPWGEGIQNLQRWKIYLRRIPPSRKRILERIFSTKIKTNYQMIDRGQDLSIYSRRPRVATFITARFEFMIYLELHHCVSYC